jgi:hypothetical protein
MRDIEVAAFKLNHLRLGEPSELVEPVGEAALLGEVSAPRIDMYWSFKGYEAKDKSLRALPTGGLIYL